MNVRYFISFHNASTSPPKKLYEGWRPITPSLTPEQLIQDLGRKILVEDYPSYKLKWIKLQKEE